MTTRDRIADIDRRVLDANLRFTAAGDHISNIVAWALEAANGNYTATRALEEVEREFDHLLAELNEGRYTTAQDRAARMILVDATALARELAR